MENLSARYSIRLQGYDYANIGAYFVTVCTKNREHLFGEIINGKMILNEYGKIAQNKWVKTTEIRPNVKLHEFIIMPDHVHGILEIACIPTKRCLDDSVVFTTNSCVRTTDSGVCVNYSGVCNTPLRFANSLQSPSNTIGAIIRGYKSAVSKQIRDHRCCSVLHTPANNIQIWQRNYYEHIIRNETEYTRIVKYIRNNPIAWRK